MQFLHKYNGKDFSFRKIEIRSSGSRDADGDTFAISGTKMRRAAFAGDFKTFRSVFLETLNDNDCRALMKEMQANLPPILNERFQETERTSTPSSTSSE